MALACGANVRSRRVTWRAPSMRRMWLSSVDVAAAGASVTSAALPEAEAKVTRFVALAPVTGKRVPRSA